MTEDEIKRLIDYFEMNAKKYLQDNFSINEANRFSSTFNELLIKLL